MIWIIGGTSEARLLVERLGSLDNYILTIATEDGKEFLETDKLYIGRLTREEMVDFAKDRGVDLIVDLSHPYATIVSENARYVRDILKIDYVRYARQRTIDQEDNIYLTSYEEAYDYLRDLEGTVFFTTGSKNIKDFEKVRGDKRFIYRVLPSVESLDLCKKSGVHMRDIVAVLGPFSKDFNKAMLAAYQPDYCVMKDSGKAGGAEERLEACRELGIRPIIIGREDEEGFTNLEEIEVLIRNRLGS